MNDAIQQAVENFFVDTDEVVIAVPYISDSLILTNDVAIPYYLNLAYLIASNNHVDACFVIFPPGLTDVVDTANLAKEYNYLTSITNSKYDPTDSILADGHIHTLTLTKNLQELYMIDTLVGKCFASCNLYGNVGIESAKHAEANRVKPQDTLIVDDIVGRKTQLTNRVEYSSMAELDKLAQDVTTYLLENEK